MILTFTAEAYRKFRYYIDETDGEISGLGAVRQVIYRAGARSLVVFEVYRIEILPQKASGSHATIAPETLAGFLTDKMRKRESVADYRVWWHSHYDFAAFFSATDTGTIENSKEFPFLISVVGNQQAQMEARYDRYHPRETVVLPVILPIYDEDEKLRAKIRDEIQTKVELNKISLDYDFDDFWGKRRENKKSGRLPEADSDFRSYYPFGF